MQHTDSTTPVWDDKLRTGIDIIDAQHEAIALLAAKVIKDPETFLASDTGVTFLTDFYQLVAFHFDTEEQLMAQADASSDWIEAHTKEHSWLLETIVSYSYDQTIGHDPKRVADIMQDLHEIIVGHVLKYDLGFKKIARALS